MFSCIWTRGIRSGYRWSGLNMISSTLTILGTMIILVSIGNYFLIILVTMIILVSDGSSICVLDDIWILHALLKCLSTLVNVLWNWFNSYHSGFITNKVWDVDRLCVTFGLAKYAKKSQSFGERNSPRNWYFLLHFDSTNISFNTLI